MNIKEFFVDENITIPFKLFGKTHIFLLSLVIIGSILIYLNRSHINKIKPATKRKITKTIAIVLLLNLLTLYIFQPLFHNFDFKDMLPLHLCYMSNIFYIYVILFNRTELYKYTYFLCFLGPIPAIIFFNVPSVWESFNFYLYVISHHVLVLGGLATFYMYPKKIEMKEPIKLAIILNIMYIIMSIYNNHFQTNYFFSAGIPNFIIDMFPFLKYIPTTLILEIVAILSIYFIYNFFNKENIYLTKE